MRLFGEIVVRSKGRGSKVLTRDINQYINIQEYNSFVGYLNKARKNILKLGVEYDLNDVLLDEKSFNLFVAKLNNKKNIISHNEIFQKCWIITIYKSRSSIHIFNTNPLLLRNNKSIFNNILKEYGLVNGEAKYELLNLKYDINSTR